MKVEEITSRPQPSLRAGHRRYDREIARAVRDDVRRRSETKIFLMELFRPPSVRIPAFQRTR